MNPFNYLASYITHIACGWGNRGAHKYASQAARMPASHLDRAERIALALILIIASIAAAAALNRLIQTL